MGISERKEREKLRRRNEIIDAAEAVFFSKGIEHATMDDVAEKAELSKGTLYLYFKNKEELQYAIKMRASAILKERFQKAINPKLNGLENVALIGRSFIEYSNEFSGYFHLLMHFEGKSLENLNLENPFIKKFFEEESPLILFREIIEKGQQDGSVREDIPALVIAHNLWAMTTGVLLLLTQQREIIDLCHPGTKDEEFVEALFLIFRQGLQKISKL